MAFKPDNTDNLDMDTVCDLLDKTLIQQLHLMEEKIKLELSVESGINHGCIQLAKSRYIMGQNSVSRSKLPVEATPEFLAETKCEVTNVDNIKQYKAVRNDACTVNPLHWFGILVPKNLHTAKKVFRNTLNAVVECVNVQIRLLQNMRNMEMLKEYKKLLSS